jgi:putative salt-induced outer membrane protein YdiY
MQDLRSPRWLPGAAALLLAFAALPASPLAAADPAPPPSPWSLTLGAGLSLTAGNSDTRGYNGAFSLLYDPKEKTVFKAELLYLRAESDGVPSVDKTSASLRYERKLSGMVFGFAQASYLKDRFKEISYLLSPIVGAGVKVVKSETMELSFDAAVGGVFEGNPGREAHGSGAYQAGQAFLWKVSKSASFTEKASGLWKANDTADSLYHFEAGLAASVSKRSELKLSYLYDYKSRPPDPKVKRGDSALLVTFLYKL